jgi:hypothetical protein
MPETAVQRLLGRLDEIERSTEELTLAVRRSASRRATIALAVGIIAVAGALLLSSIGRVNYQQTACESGNAARVNLLMYASVHDRALLDGFVVGVSSTPEARERNLAARDRILAAIDADPEVIALRDTLAPRECKITWTDYLGMNGDH